LAAFPRGLNLPIYLFTMKRLRVAAASFAFGLLTFSQVGADILTDLESVTPLYDSAIKGVVNDANNLPGEPGNLSGVPAIENTGDHTHAAGLTFHIQFTPNANDLSGTRLLIEIGANNSGSGLYLIGGVPSFASKHGANDGTVPSSLNDATLNAIAVQSGIGKLDAAVRYSFSASWNHKGTLELIVTPDGEAEVFNSFAISGPPGNWSGNDTVSVKTIARGNAGGLGGNNSVLGPPFDVQDASNFGGTIHRALLWNAYSVTELQLTAPVVKGLAVTKLPEVGKVRLHWSVSEGGLPNPTTIVIKDSANNAVHTPAELVGFLDLVTTETNFSVTATNATGNAERSATLEEDTPFTATVRQDGPIAWYRFNETAGSQLFVDSAENGAPHNGHLLGSVLSGADGFIDKAGAFEGASAVVGGNILNPGSSTPVPVAPITPRQGFTIEAIVKRETGINGNHVLISQTDLDGTGRVILGVTEGGRIYSQLAGGPNQRKDADEKLPDNVWSHFVLVVDAGTETPGTADIRWYLDGKKIGSSLDGTNPDGSTFNANFLLEASAGNWVFASAKNLASEFWKGDIDEVAVYPKLLDDPNGDGDGADSRIAAHHGAWYPETSGILDFRASAPTVVTGSSVELVAKVGSDVTAVSIDGIGNVPLVDGIARVTVSPTATTTYQVTAGGTGPSYTKDFTVVYQQLTVPIIQGLEATTLPSTNKVRIHWNVTAGDFPTPVNVKVKHGVGQEQASDFLTGFVDIATEDAVNVSLEVTNLIGTVSANASAPAAETPFSSAVRADEPTAWFRFNEAVNSVLIVDSAENAVPHNGTVFGMPVSGATGFVGGAATFNNSSGIVTDRIINLPDLEAGYTIEAIIRNDPGDSGTNRAIISQHDLNGTGRLIVSVDDNGVVRSVLGGGIRKDADGRIPGGVWSHLVVKVDVVNNELRWYIDGVYAGTSADGVNPDGTTFDPGLLFEASDGAWLIGVHKTLTGNFWKGEIDEIAVYDKLLDDSQVEDHRDAWWSETSGLLHATVANDTINAGEFVDLLINVGADVTSVTVDHGVGAVPVVNGRAVVPLHPSVTTIYQITVEGPNGTQTVTVTITVNGGVSMPLQVSSALIENGNFVIRFQGSPSTSYAVKGGEDLVTFPQDFGTAPTDGSGMGVATVPLDAGKARQFFILQLPQ
jgi:hypothetical protein